MTKYINQWHDDRFFYRPQRNECGFREMRVIFQRKLVLWIIFDHLCRTTTDSSPLRLPQNIIVQNTMCDHSYGRNMKIIDWFANRCPFPLIYDTLTAHTFLRGVCVFPIACYIFHDRDHNNLPPPLLYEYKKHPQWI